MASSLPKLATESPLPDHWYWVFGIIEPISTFAGAAYAISLPAGYYNDLVPSAFIPSAADVVASVAETRPVGLLGKLWPSSTAHKASIAGAHAFADAAARGGVSPAATMALGQLGSCFILIGLNSAVFFYLVRRYLSNNAALQERFISSILVVLAVCDLIHTGLTVYALPSPSPGLRGSLEKSLLLLRPGSWNSLLLGNIVATMMLFTARVVWFLGVGREVVQPFPLSLPGVEELLQGDGAAAGADGAVTRKAASSTSAKDKKKK